MCALVLLNGALNKFSLISCAVIYCIDECSVLISEFLYCLRWFNGIIGGGHCALLLILAIVNLSVDGLAHI